MIAGSKCSCVHLVDSDFYPRSCDSNLQLSVLSAAFGRRSVAFPRPPIVASKSTAIIGHGKKVYDIAQNRFGLAYNSAVAILHRRGRARGAARQGAAAQHAGNFTISTKHRDFDAPHRPTSLSSDDRNRPAALTIWPDSDNTPAAPARTAAASGNETWLIPAPSGATTSVASSPCKSSLPPGFSIRHRVPRVDFGTESFGTRCFGE